MLDSAPTESALSFGFDQLNHAIDAINNAPDCRGVAFAYELVFSAKYLFANHFKRKSRTLMLGTQNAVQGLHIANRARTSPNCGQPNYEATLNVVRETQPMVAVTDTAGSERQGQIQLFTPTFTRCANTQGDIYVWPILRDRTITFIPDFFFGTIPMIWKIDDIEIHDVEGFLKPTKEVYIPVNNAAMAQPVTIDFTVSAVGGTNKLTLNTHGADGNYYVKISLLLQFFDSQPPMVFFEEDVFIDGQQVDGGPAYHDYLDCVLEYIRTGYKIYMRQWVSPGTPRDQKLEFERNVLEIARMLSSEIRIQDVS
jgi:hypothetical protein